MSKMIDETPYVSMLAGNGGFMLPKVASIHDMRQKQLAILPAVLYILTLKRELGTGIRDGSLIRFQTE